MREIKFRAWSKEFRKMVDLQAITPLALSIEPELVGARIGVYVPDDDRLQIMQFTGLHDKNGAEIYEGDIVKTHFADEDLVGSIKYSEKWAKFYFGVINKYGCGVALDPESVFYWYYAEDDEGTTSIAEIIGNIYENPELTTTKGEGK